jgi:small subunit ribosomal protein S16
MAVVIRMKRTGRRNRPCYRISVAESRRPRDGRTLETLGLYDPIAPNAEAQASLNVERARVWLEQGALPSHTVLSLFKRFGVYEGHEKLLHEPKRDRSGRRKDTAKAKARIARKADFEARKSARREARAAAKKAAAAAAAAAEGGDA